MAKVKVWRSDHDGTLVHDGCFGKEEVKEDGYQVVSLDDLSEDDECEVCCGPFVSGPEDDEDDDNANDANDAKEVEEKD